MDKSSLKKALIEAKEIENFATESAKKIIEKEFLPKIEDTVKQTLMEMEEKEMKENSEVSLDAGSSVNVKVSKDGTITISADEKEITPSVDALSTDNFEEVPVEDEDLVSTETNDMEETEKEEEEEELFEIVEELNEEEGTENIKDVEEKINSLESKIDKILELVGGEKAEGEVEIVDDEETEEEATTEKEEEAPAEKEEEAPAEKEEEAPAEKEEDSEAKPETEEEASEEEELVFEFDDVLDESKNKDLQEIKKMLKELEELENEELEEEFNFDDEEEFDLSEEVLEEILKEYGDEHEMTVADALNSMDEEEEMCEIEIEEGEEEIEENSGISLTNRQGQNLKPNTPHKKVRTGLNESVKAQYESKLDELKKENESLKTALKEYKDSFVVLRKQINEVQTFNAKLAYANKVFTKGGLTNEEKTRISEQFDVCNTAEEAKALYNKLIKEGASSVKTVVDKIKLPKAAGTSSKGAIYESEETKRMKKLAGII